MSDSDPPWIAYAMPVFVDDDDQWSMGIRAMAAAPAAPAAPRRAKSWATRRYQSLYTPHRAPDRCNKVSPAFKQSKFDYMIVILSHGGTVDDGTGGILRGPMFKTGQNVIFPVRFGSSIDILNGTDSMIEFTTNIPMPSLESVDLTGAKLEQALNTTSFTKCIRQYDVGESVPNLEIFTPGMHYGDDDMYLYRYSDGSFMSLKKYMKSIVEKVHKDLVRMPNPKLRMPKKTNKKKEVTKTIQKTIKTKKIKMNMNPLFKTSAAYKQKMKQPDDAPLTLADLCDAEHGLFETLFAKLKREKVMAPHVEVSNIPVVVLVCRAGHEFSDTDTSSHPADSPVSANYDTDVTAMSSASDSAISVSSANGAFSNGTFADGAFDGGGRNATKTRRNRRNATKKRRK
jgi:hypothetical protein